MTTVSIAEAEKDLSALLQRAQTESVAIRDENGVETILLSMRPKTEAELEAAWERAEALSRIGSDILEKSLAKDGITVEQFLADALADV
jgi:hypothetical protein